MNTKKEISWLHISDLHIEKGSRYDQDRVLGDLLNTLKYEYDNKLKPNFIVITGDLAKAGKKEEYDNVLKFLHKIEYIYKIERRNIFIVPGNHDIDRDIAKHINVSISDDPRDIDNFFSKKDTSQRKPVFLKFKSYNDFFKKFYGNSYKFNNEKDLYYIGIITIDDFKIGIAAFNSSWISKNDSDGGKLIIGERLINDAYNDLIKYNPLLKIAIFHHPISMLTWTEQNVVKKTLHDKFEIIMHGHNHNIDSSLVIDHSETVILSSGASYQGSNFRNSFYYGTINIENMEVSIAPFTWIRSHSNLWIKDMTIFPESRENGIGKLKLSNTINYENTTKKTGDKFKYSKYINEFNLKNFIKIRAEKEDKTSTSNIIHHLESELRKYDKIIEKEKESTSDQQYYEITGKSIRDLKNEGIPKHIIDKLDIQKDKQFPDKELFRKKIQQLINKSDFYRFGSVILEKCLNRNDNESANFLILGETGAGKTTLSKALFSTLSKNPDYILLYINLAEYFDGKIQDLGVLFYKNDLKVRDFIKNNTIKNKYKIITIVDSLDKMIVGATYIQKINQFNELKMISRESYATFIFARTHFFKDIYEEDILGFTKLRILPLRESDIKNYLVSYLNFNNDIVSQILSNNILMSFFERPLILNMVKESNFEKFNKATNIIELTKQYIEGWLVREIPHSIIDKHKKEILLSLIAVCSYQFRGKNITYIELNDVIKKQEVDITKDEIESFNHDLRTCSFLRRNEFDQYEFMHDIFYEYFTTTYIITGILEMNVEALSYYILDSNIVDSLIKRICSEIEYNQIIISIQKLWDKQISAVASSNLFSIYSLLDGDISLLTFSGRNFDNLYLNNHKFDIDNLKNTIFLNCIFHNMSFNNNNVSRTTFNKCTFSKCKIDNIKFNNCKFNDCFYSDCYFLESFIINSNISDSLFEKCDLNLIITGSFLNKVTFSCDAKIDISSSELCNVWHDQDYNFSRSSYFCNTIVNNATKYSISMLPKSNQPRTDIKLDKSLNKNIVIDDNEEIVDRRKLQSEIDKCEDPAEKMRMMFLSGKSKTEAKEITKFREKINELRKKQ